MSRKFSGREIIPGNFRKSGKRKNLKRKLIIIKKKRQNVNSSNLRAYTFSYVQNKNLSNLAILTIQGNASEFQEIWESISGEKNSEVWKHCLGTMALTCLQ